ncbi:MAG: DUF6089 family protein [Vicingaceae bacterium]
MKALFSIILLFSFSFLSFAQKENNEANSKAYAPTIGLGIGTIGFYGDLNDKNYGSPLNSNIGYSLYLIQPVTDFLNVRFSFMTGKVREEERSLARNLNFETQITSGSILAEYNFSHFLPAKRKITPFVTTGFEVLEFNPKSDLLSADGEPYNYWTDGTIRDVPESSVNADQSTIIYRDYSYESDIRTSGFNNSNSYAERSFAIPVGIGVTMHLNDQFDFRVESVFHFAFTDYIDGISPSTSSEILGDKKANDNDDKYYYNGISLSYNFQNVDRADPFEKTREQSTEKIDFLAYGNTEDFDGDGIIDLIDDCPGSPKDVAVDSVGCPVDTDGDGIPDYKDEEINSKYPEFANDKGVSLTDEMIYESYMRYKDSTLEFAETIERDFTGKRKGQNLYRVKVGEYNKGEAPKDMSLLLSLSDLSKVDQGDKTLYTVGNYKTLPEASNRATELRVQGFDPTDVVKRNSRGNYETVIASKRLESGSDVSNSNENNSTENQNIDQVVFRVQLGAFKAKPTDSKYQRVSNLFIVEANGYYRYMSGSFTNFNDAAKHKVRMIVDGFKGAFVVAYKNGKRVSLKSVGVDSISSDPIIGK